ncbi:DUF551 domain-containing protein [Klebsiella variicola]|uniref:DUF551 domain-containing protein n=1 Tax=Klebsiella variicola TaxID=244366 RepID=UPI00227A5538|nr:DUF551 domain-containing protein [Klebsiella variicola]
MTKSTITRERLEQLANFKGAPVTRQEEQELARMALAAIDSEPVAYTDERNLGYIDRGRETAYLWGKQNSESSDVALYRHAQPAPAVPGKWIPVSEQMPESNKFVLVSNGVWVGQGLYDDSEHLESDEHWQDEHREFINVLHHPVTHWMPLPAGPQGVKGE